MEEIEKLIKKQRKDFDIWFKEYPGVLTTREIQEWYEVRFKQFIDGLIEVQNEHMQKELSVERFARPDFYKGYEASKNETIAHLKEIKENITN